jgi:hypothetical protein
MTCMVRPTRTPRFRYVCVRRLRCMYTPSAHLWCPTAWSTGPRCARRSRQTHRQAPVRGCRAGAATRPATLGPAAHGPKTASARCCAPPAREPDSDHPGAWRGASGAVRAARDLPVGIQPSADQSRSPEKRTTQISQVAKPAEQRHRRNRPGAAHSRPQVPPSHGPRPMSQHRSTSPRNPSTLLALASAPLRRDDERPVNRRINVAHGCRSARSCKDGLESNDVARRGTGPACICTDQVTGERLETHCHAESRMAHLIPGAFAAHCSS